MKLKFMIFVMALAAMGPARDAPPPDGAAVRTQDGVAAATRPRDTVPQRNPARLPPVAQRVEPDPLPDASPWTTALRRCWTPRRSTRTSSCGRRAPW